MTRRSPEPPRRWLIACVAGFALYAALIALRQLADFDWHTTVSIQRWCGARWLDQALFTFTVLGSIELTCMAVAAIGGWALGRGRWRLAAAWWAAFVVTTLVEVAGKLWLPQPHVPEFFHRSPWADIGLIHVHMPHAFPSGHTLRLTLIFGYLLWVCARRQPAAWRRPAMLALAAAILLTGFSRVYLGDHWISDVLGGYLLAGAGLWWVLWADARERHRTQPKA